MVEHVDKTAFSMWVPAIADHFPRSSTVDASLGEPHAVAIVGIEAHVCVTQTALDLLREGHKVYIIADGVGSCHPEEVPIALQRLRNEGAVVTTSESWMFEVMGDAAIDEWVSSPFTFPLFPFPCSFSFPSSFSFTIFMSTSTLVSLLFSLEPTKKKVKSTQRRQMKANKLSNLTQIQTDPSRDQGSQGQYKIRARDAVQDMKTSSVCRTENIHTAPPRQEGKPWQKVTV